MVETDPLLATLIFILVVVMCLLMLADAIWVRGPRRREPYDA